MKSIINGICEFVFSSPFVAELGQIGIDFSDEKVCGVAPSGQFVMEEYINSAKIWQYNASFFIVGCTIGDVARLENAEFMENLTHWISVKNDSGEFPILPDYAIADSFSADNGMLFNLSENGNSGTYQIQLHLMYTERTRT